jgi:hypothetical protein
MRLMGATADTATLTAITISESATLATRRFREGDASGLG